MSEDRGRRIHLPMPNTMQHGVSELDVLVAVYRSTQRHLFVGAAGQVAVAHGVHAFLGGNPQVLDGRRLLHAAATGSVQAKTKKGHRWRRENLSARHHHAMLMLRKMGGRGTELL